MSNLKIEKFARKPFYVDVVEVTEKNAEAVAEWCHGEVRFGKGPDNTDGSERPFLYVKVRVHRPLFERQTKAYVGDYVLYAGTGFKVYTAKAFKNSFNPVDSSLKEEPRDAELCQYEYDVEPDDEAYDERFCGEPAVPGTIACKMHDGMIEVMTAKTG